MRLDCGKEAGVDFKVDIPVCRGLCKVLNEGRP